MSQCTFCRILKGELPSSSVAEFHDVVAFLDIHPVSEGHTLVIPRRHVQSFTDLTSAECTFLLTTAQTIADRMKSELPWCEGVTLSLADGESTEQEVPHAHLHVIPRRAGDGFGWRFPPGYQETPAERERLDEVAKLIAIR